MNHTDITALIDTMDEQGVENLLALFADETLTVSSPPRSGLVMMTVTDSFGTDFHLGEVLVTEARILFRDCEGFGMVLGEAPRKALVRAAADAVLRCPEPTGIQKILAAFLKRQEMISDAKSAQNAALVAATKVNFDLMPGA